jgi:hypothetical protein
MQGVTLYRAGKIQELHFKLIQQIPIYGGFSNKFNQNTWNVVGDYTYGQTKSLHCVALFISRSLGITGPPQGQFIASLLTILNFVLVRLIVIDFIEVFNC